MRAKPHPVPGQLLMSWADREREVLWCAAAAAGAPVQSGPPGQPVLVSTSPPWCLRGAHQLLAPHHRRAHLSTWRSAECELHCRGRRRRRRRTLVSMSAAVLLEPLCPRAAHLPAFIAFLAAQAGETAQWERCQLGQLAARTSSMHKSPCLICEIVLMRPLAGCKVDGRLSPPPHIQN